MSGIRSIVCSLALLMLPVAGWAADHPILPIGSAAPDFSLPGADGKTHKLSDYASSKILVVVFTCNHCPNAQMYEGRVTQMYNDYRDKGVALVAISPNDPKAIRIDELDSSDISDTLDEMKIRVAYKHLPYPYLYDGETESVSRAYGPQASPHIFIFDQQRKLRYEGAIDDSYRVEFVKRHYALDALDALLADKDVAVKHTGAFGCSTKWSDKEAANVAFMEKLNAQPVALEMVSADALKSLHTNADGNVRLIQFWSTKCSSCLEEFAGIQDIYRMYSDRNFELVVVSMNKPEEKAAVKQWLDKKHATSRNLLFDSENTAELQKAFDPKWDSGVEVPYTILLDADGNVLYQTAQPVDQLKLRRTILANLPSAYIGLNNYWLQKVKRTGIVVLAAIIAPALGAQTVVRTVPVGTTPIALAANPLTHKVYVVNHGSNSVTILDSETYTTSTLNVEDRPEAVAINPETNKIYITNSGSDSVSVIDGKTGTISSTVHVGDYPQALAVNTATNKVYVANNFGHSVTVVDGATNATTTIQVGQGPRGIALNAVTNKVYTVNYGSQDVTVINGATWATSSIGIGKHPWAVAVDARANKIYALSEDSASVSVIDGVTNASTTVSVGAIPFAVEVNPATEKAYVLSYGNDSMAVIDGSTATVTTTVSLGTPPQAIAIDPKSDRIYIANQRTASLTVIDGKTNLPAATVKVGTIPYALEVDASTHLLYVANFSSNDVTVVGK